MQRHHGWSSSVIDRDRFPPVSAIRTKEQQQQQTQQLSDVSDGNATSSYTARFVVNDSRPPAARRCEISAAFCALFPLVVGGVRRFAASAMELIELASNDCC